MKSRSIHVPCPSVVGTCLHAFQPCMSQESALQQASHSAVHSIREYLGRIGAGQRQMLTGTGDRPRRSLISSHLNSSHLIHNPQSGWRAYLMHVPFSAMVAAREQVQYILLIYIVSHNS